MTKLKITVLKRTNPDELFDEKGTAITCCADGMRPVLFKVERI